MDIILTHEQADFDAAASVLAAWLLEPQRIPVLSQRVNRNVAAFLEDYKEEFPFRTWAHIPNKKVESILLTDTQSYNGNNRFTPDTTVTVIDHHQPRLKLPENWKCTFERIGACTTIMTERLREAQIIPEQLYCSMLLMGIYEDTGFLSYGGTTARDASVAAWLLENGADLDLLHKYLNPPLTDGQTKLCDTLLQNCELLNISGQQIVIASADAREMPDEFSTVAHHLRDMLAPDALIILLASRSGIRLIARATNNRIDVGSLMKRYNGGGHSRAAAGLISLTDKEKEDLPEILARTREELIAVLPDFITPPLTVGQIMSANPLLLDAEMPVREADILIQRYGYEGYPIIDAGKKLIGLLNSRSVERARAFHLNLPVEELMEAGTFSVHEQDSVEHLKELMNHSGWGQIPVVSEKDDQVIGIVTRTDLIKTLTDNGSVPGNRNLSAELERVLPPASLQLIHMAARAAYNCNYPVYLVGGFVRDLLLEQPVMDFDIVVEGDAIHLARTLVNVYGGKIRTHPQFGTAKWMIHEIREQILAQAESSGSSADEIPDSLDLISARTEFYDYPTALPKVERSSIKLDLHRRDFTINTMAIRLDGKHYGDLLDFWGGYNDLQRRLIRVLHSLSFTDDPTRMLRAVRFEQRFGFVIESHTLQLMQNAVSLLKQLSGRRILHEFNLFFHEENPPAGFSRLDQFGMLAEIHPEMHWDENSSQNWKRLFEYEQEPFWKSIIPDHLDFVYDNGKFGAWWGAYSRQTLLEISDRLQLTQKTSKMLLSVSWMNQRFASEKERWPSEITLFLEKLPLESIYCYSCLHPDAKSREVIREYITRWRLVQLFTSGDDLRALGYAPGSWIAAVLTRLRSGWIDGEISSREEEQKTLMNILPLYVKNIKKEEGNE